MKKRTFKIIKSLIIVAIILIAISLFFPVWTPKIAGENSISELRKVKVGDTSLEIMIRGTNKNNPVIIFVHGGPCCSEIPYIRKYQDLLEKSFTIVHYDQRGSGKSYEFGKDYSKVTASSHVNDLIVLTEYIEKYLKKDKVILVGHSYGTYIGLQAAAQKPELYRGYVGIGQMSNTIDSELDNLQKCINAAKAAGATKDVTYLNGFKTLVGEGKSFAPRDYVRKYGFAARKIDDNKDYRNGFLFGTEYNLLDTIRFYVASAKYQEALVMETLKNPVSDLVKTINLPVYFVMGKYDCMTSPEAANQYLKQLKGTGTREMILFKESAHYPQLEEKQRFYRWICATFSGDSMTSK
jgi:Predicted hydrolases or acyltransferases (alpha/beta hydrolase superfamily)